MRPESAASAEPASASTASAEPASATSAEPASATQKERWLLMLFGLGMHQWLVQRRFLLYRFGHVHVLYTVLGPYWELQGMRARIREIRTDQLGVRRCYPHSHSHPFDPHSQSFKLHDYSCISSSHSHERDVKYLPKCVPFRHKRL